MSGALAGQPKPMQSPVSPRVVGKAEALGPAPDLPAVVLGTQREQRAVRVGVGAVGVELVAVQQDDDRPALGFDEAAGQPGPQVLARVAARRPASVAVMPK